MSVWTEAIPISGYTSALNPHWLSISLPLSHFLRNSWEHSTNQVPLQLILREKYTQLMFLKMLFRVKEKKSGYDLNGSSIPATIPSQNLSQCLVRLWKNSFILSNINVSCCNLTSFPIHCRADRLYKEQLVKNRLEKQTVR